MRWKAPSERVQFWLAAPFVIPAAAVLIIGLSPMILVNWLESKWRGRQIAKGRHVWFAWRPVRFDAFWYDDLDSCWHWLERVERRWAHGEWEYLPLGFVDPYERSGA